MAKATPSIPEAAESVQALGKALGEAWQSISGLSLAPQTFAELQSEYLRQASELWNATIARMPVPGMPVSGVPSTGAAPKLPDRRFSAQEWAQNPGAAFVAQSYLLNSRTLMQMAEAVAGDEKTKARLRFAVQQWIDASSPSNFFALNPEAQRKAFDTKGQSLAQGLQMLMQDVQLGHVSQTDTTVFEVGRNVATTEGSIVFENDLFQLIEYKPLTEQIYAKPLLLVPPCINKYYILDLQPENSLIRYAVEQGHRTFVVSWRNPDASMADKTWDDYVEHGPITAISVVSDITGTDTFDMLGFCVGGTLLSTALAVLAARGQQPAASLTLLTTLLDFTDTGVLDLFVDEASVQLREYTIGNKSPKGPGLLEGQQLATTFSFLRPNDLVWNYVVGNYLKGEAPPPFDLLYWNGDATNLPGPMYCWYLRHMYLQDELKLPGRLTVCGEKVDLGAIRAPVYVYGSREDHIVPWTAAYRSTPLLKGDVRFVLGASGHIAGVINPPAKKKRSYWTGPDGKLPAEADDWLSTAQEHPGSWWTDWSAWLASHAGEQVPAPKAPGNHQHKAIEPAPGRYVKQKA